MERKDMHKIKNIAFDLGGVVIALSYEKAVKRFEEIGLHEAHKHLDAFCQQGIFGDLEKGLITPEEFRVELSRMIDREITYDECMYAWHGYVEDVPQRNLQMLLRLRQLGYKVCLLSNTNPYMMQWAMSTEFDGNGHAIQRCGNGEKPHLASTKLRRQVYHVHADGLRIFLHLAQ